MNAAAGRAPLVLTLGEPAGIGPDITIDAWLARRELRLPAFLFLGDAEVLQRRAERMRRRIRVALVEPGGAQEAFDDALPCLAGAPAADGEAGVLKAADAPAVVASIRAAVELTHAGLAAGIVTNPIHKKSLNDIGFPHPGHTEYLGALAEELYGAPATPVMMLVGPDLRVVPVTIHIPLAAVAATLDAATIIRTVRVVARDLQSRFGIERPRIAISGLNPHAGEEGMLGREEIEVIEPAIAALRREGVDARGPLSADAMFHAPARAGYDAAVCMYHDQALIPIKTLAFDEGVNVTLGLPFVRTSPDHGTALPIAGGGTARATSLAAALRLADRLARRGRPA